MGYSERYQHQAGQYPHKTLRFIVMYKICSTQPNKKNDKNTNYEVAEHNSHRQKGSNFVTLFDACVYKCKKSGTKGES